MEHSGILSLIPPIVAIVLAIWTRQVYLSLLTGIFLGYLVLASGAPIAAFTDTIQGLVEVFKDAGNTRTIIFCALIGGLLAIIQRSGGVEGFMNAIQQRILKADQTNLTYNRKKIKSLAFLSGLIVFVETSISALTVGTIFRPLFDKLKISREKLAYLADSSSAPSSILIPFNAWGAFIMGLLAAGGMSDPFGTLIRTIPFNIYPILTILIGFVVIWWGKDIGPMRSAERLAALKSTSPSNSEELSPGQDDFLMQIKKKEGITPKAYNMLIPIGVMILSMPLLLVYTGMELVPDQLAGFDFIFEAMGAGSGSTAVLTAIILALLTGAFLYKLQGLMKIREWMDWVLKGTTSMLPLAVLMLLAFAIGQICRDLGTGNYVAQIITSWLHPGFLPVLVFLCTCFIAFSTGTSWGTFAIMMAIALPISNDIGADTYLVIAAVLGGGVFGDHCSPISDTTIISSLASGVDHIEHVKTQLPYALIAGTLAAIFYIVAGFL